MSDTEYERGYEKGFDDATKQIADVFNVDLHGDLHIPVMKVTYGTTKRVLLEHGNLRTKFFIEKNDFEWIPVSERLPEENGDYFVTLENGVVEILGYSTTQRTTYPKGFYYISNGFSWRQTINPVIAWMPLPEPYRAESEEI